MKIFLEEDNQLVEKIDIFWTTPERKPLARYINRLIIAFSVFFNVILGGYSNQTFSARNYDLKMNGYPNLCWLIDLMFYKDGDHCEKAWIFWIRIKDFYTTEDIFR